MNKLTIVFSFLILLSTSSYAQQYGHLNFGNLLSAMPETKAADSVLETFQTQLVTKGEQKVKALQIKYEEYSKKIADVSPNQAKTWEDEITKMQQGIAKYEQEVQQKVAKKRQDLLEPIIKKAQKAINEVAKEKGYVMIFDSSVFNSILYGAESTDIMIFVTAKLGL